MNRNKLPGFRQKYDTSPLRDVEPTDIITRRKWQQEIHDLVCVAGELFNVILSAVPAAGKTMAICDILGTLLAENEDFIAIVAIPMNNIEDGFSKETNIINQEANTFPIQK